ncbi:MAG: polysaccharide lyase beta-sandwich domain-containing protein [Prevotella sp.]|jgi:chondroitin AC lyase|nr:polysaccharide lyase beta-sandwich domain-containing protein [Prevotella sp.]
MNRRALLILFPFLFFAFAQIAAADEIKTIKQNYKQVLLSGDPADKPLLSMLTSDPQETFFSDQMVVELMERYPVGKARVEELLGKIQADGSWSDVDYANQNRSGWRSKIHVERILELARVHAKPDSEFYNSKEVADVIHQTLKYWFDKKPVSPNWWYNQIGIPKILGAIFILFEDQLSIAEKENTTELMENAKFGMTGQNKVWLAGNVLVRGLMQNDIDLVKASRDTIASEIRTDQIEGIKADDSFHQHGAQQQFGNYGAAYISSMGMWARLFCGTSIAFNQDQLNILNKLINQGYAWILRKGYMDINALGRQFFHQAQRHKAFTVGFAANAMSQADIANKNEYQNLLADNFFSAGEGSSLIGLKHFWMSGQTVYRRPQWMASVKTSSKRVVGGEAGNGDNLKGYYLADGALYTYMDGDEYLNIFPCWDWRKIPGITSYQTDSPLKQLSWGGYCNQSDFVGNVSDGTTGMTAMDFNRDRITARKSWIFTGEFVLCLGAGITSDSSLVVTTSIDQRIKKDDLYYLNNNSREKVDSVAISANDRFFHDKTGYIILQASQGKAITEKRQGSWGDIMSMYPEDFVEKKDVFSLWIDHGTNPEDASYEYMIFPASTLDRIKQFDTKSIKVISNTKDMQAVKFDDKIYIAAYKPADIRLTKNIHFKSSDAGLFLIQVQAQGEAVKTTVSDPTQKLEELNFSINGKSLIMKLPQGEMKGTSVTKRLFKSYCRSFL